MRQKEDFFWELKLNLKSQVGVQFVTNVFLHCLSLNLDLILLNKSELGSILTIIELYWFYKIIH